jgi:hypothetical protein
MGTAVEKAIPTLSLTALDHNGLPLSNYSVELDGILLSPEAVRQPIPVDPGTSHLSLRVPGTPVTSLTFPVRAKEKNQRVTVRLAAPEPAFSPEPQFARVRTAGYVLGGIGVVGLASFIGFGLAGYKDERQLESNRVSINERDDLRAVDKMRQKYVVADVSLGIGLVSLGAATYLLYVTPPSKTHAPALATTAVFLRGSTDSGALFVRSEF